MGIFAIFPFQARAMDEELAEYPVRKRNKINPAPINQSIDQKSQSFQSQ